MVESLPYIILAGAGCVALLYINGLRWLLRWMQGRIRHPQRDIRIRTIHLSRQMVLRAGMLESQFLQLQLDALQDHDTAVQQAVILALGGELEHQQKFSSGTSLPTGDLNVIPVIPVFLQTLDHEQSSLRHAANVILKAWLHTVDTVVFGTSEETGIPVLRNPDVRHLTVPFMHLKSLVIDLDTCDFDLVRIFFRYMRRILSVRYLKQAVTVQLSGNLASHALEDYNPLADCHAVHVKVEQVVFGIPPGAHDDLSNTLYNPNFSTCRLPLRHLKQVIIQPAAGQLHRIERFLTYAVNYVGQEHLKQSVDVYVESSTEDLHPNLRNALGNLCRHVYEHSL